MAAPAQAAVASAMLTAMADEITCAIRDTDSDSLYTLLLAIMAAATSGLVRALAAGGRVPRRTGRVSARPA